PFGVALGVWVVAGAVVEWTGRIKLFAAPWRESLARAAGLPRAAHDTALAHAGLGIAMIGIVATSAWQSERILAMKPGERGVADDRGPNYAEQVARLEVTRGSTFVAELRPSRRLFDTPRQATTEAAIHASWRGDLYLTLGDRLDNGGYVVRAWFHPLVRLIWL